ncbi:methyl-accepting chemotaxis protein [Alteromonas mediterranea]|uniref:Chemotaxis sensory transducer n=1 Tax=Alteromonas mediterranea (strain DSM 17117 / CIP 110805 / LMG 28347 / Deep ecotype) TaxID=1774373 RepID=F2GCZ7_ALTMD|nr:methyl-accepting chemotaxis protein [Alteromonas mediterranea]AEA99144.1 chemotaxis sensory transducer [Alteromonas mediterranea DE]CAH1208766.1 hypothetical protein ISS312_01192 [Alteromonas mediterranea]
MKVLEKAKQYYETVLAEKIKVLKEKTGSMQDSLLLWGGLLSVALVGIVGSLNIPLELMGVQAGVLMTILGMASFMPWYVRRQNQVFTNKLKSQESYLQETSSQLSETHTQVNDYVAILKGQMDGISAITEDASMELMKALYEIESSIQDSIDNVELGQKDALSCKEKSADEFELAAQRLSNIKEMIRTQREQQIADTEAIQGVMREVENLKELTELVKNIASQTNLLALNAAIEAARAGEYGRGFAVVAEQVRILSSQSSDAAEKIETGIKSALDAAHMQGEKMLNSTRANDTCELLTGFSESLENITAHYRALEDLNPKMLACFSQSATEVAFKVSGAIAKIQFQDIIRQRTEHVKLEQDAIVSLFGQFSSYINNREHFDESFNLSTKEMFEKYVMEDQRKIHFDINESSPEEKNEFEEAREPKIELF